MLVYLLHDETQTKQLAESMANDCPENERFIIFLKGELGSGKTSFARFFIHALGHEGLVKSPTYTLVETYSLEKHHIFHLDLYRLSSPTELSETGLQDDFNENATWLIEWPERAVFFLPTPDIIATFTLIDSHREVLLQAESQLGHQLLAKIKTINS